MTNTLPRAMETLMSNSNLRSPAVAKANNIATAAVFIVSDVTSSANWYREVLGFDVELTGTPPSFAIAERGGAAIMLKQGNELPKRNRDIEDGTWDAYIWVRYVDLLFGQLKQRDTVIISAPTKQPHGCIELEIEDPDGWRICFGECK